MSGKCSSPSPHDALLLGVVFSLTIVVLQIASAQFTPRVMRNLTGERGTAERLRSALVTGPERTRQQDVELGIRQLADIAVRVLSPAVNNPTTATLCIDRRGQLLVRAASRDETDVTTGPGGGRVMLRGPSFARLTDVAFTQIRHYGAGDPLVATHLMTTLGEVAARISDPQREPLREQATALLMEVRQVVKAEYDLSRVEAAATWTRRESG